MIGASHPMLCEHCGGEIGEHQPRVANKETGRAFHALLDPNDWTKVGPCFEAWLKAAFSTPGTAP